MLVKGTQFGFPKRRCNARNRHIVLPRKDGFRGFDVHTHCQNWPVRGAARCRLHGGLSTGPRTPEGKERSRSSIPAMVEGRRKWLERMRSQGKKLTCGRRVGEAWVTPRMRAAAAKREAERWAALTPAQRLAEQLEAQRLATKKAIQGLQDHFARQERYRQEEARAFREKWGL
jgi:hypothetical protein